MEPSAQQHSMLGHAVFREALTLGVHTVEGAATLALLALVLDVANASSFVSEPHARLGWIVALAASGALVRAVERWWRAVRAPRVAPVPTWIDPRR